MQKNKQKKGICSYLKRQKVAIFFYVLVYLIAGACTISNTILAATTIEKITLGFHQEAFNLMWIIIGTYCIRRFCWFMSGYIYDKYSIKIMAEINHDLSVQAFKLNSRTYSDHDTGTFVQRIVSDPERVVQNLADIVDMFTDIITSLIMIVYIATLNIFVSLILITLVSVGLIIEFFRIKLKRKNRKETRKRNDKINSLTTEIVRSEKDIKALGLEDKLAEVSKVNYDEYRKAVFKQDFTDTKFWTVRNFLIEVVGVFLLMFALHLMDKGLLTLATYMIIYANHGNVYGLVYCLGNIANRFVEIKVSTERMFSLFDEDEFVTEKFGKVTLENVVGDIEFKDVGFIFREYEYKESEDKKKKAKRKKKQKVVLSENKVFDNLSFKIPHNKTVAFVGKSGSGKSTILNLMSKMYEVEEGAVLIDGVNINDLSKETLRKNFSLVNQFPYIFDMTIKENLLLAKADATDEEIKNAIHLASLDEFIGSLKKGVDTKVGESGIKLSGGQKQRLAIARAFLRKSRIILFDESTSSLDNIAQNEVKKSIDALKGQGTIVVVAHRLSTIKDSDIIFFLDDGKIIDKGTFEELFENNEKFKNMFLAENI